MEDFKIILKSIKFNDISIIIKYSVDVQKNKYTTIEDIDNLSLLYNDAINKCKKSLGIKDGDGWYVANVEKV